jgi:hypothetical protein
MRVIRELALPGPPRWAVYGDERDRVHVNIREPAEILVIDCAGLEVDGEFAVPAAGPHGLWLDGDRLLCAADEDALVVVELGSGEPVASLPFPAPRRRHARPRSRTGHVAIGEPGVVCSFDSDRLEPVEVVETEMGAHTIGWDPDGRCLYVFCPASGGAMVFEERA